MAKTDAKNDIEEDEGARSFAVLIQQIGDGDLHHELGSKTQELVSALVQFQERYQRDAKGTLTLVLSVTAMGNGSLAVSGDVKTKTPTAKRSGSIFWRTKGNNLTVENPRQQKLALREVPSSGARTKDLSADTAVPVRGV